MNKSDFKSLGTTNQLDYINRLEETNRQKVEMIKQLEKDNKSKNCHWNHAFFKGRGDHFCGNCGIRLN
ncbi:MAG: hypothetical protein KAS32_10065 [Candidatus Peribacteraceae bacterium]|nr:hypothetical protein [Candidatus Peribacteraceae bacterium]